MSLGPTGRGARLAGMHASQMAHTAWTRGLEDMDRGYQNAEGILGRANDRLNPLYGTAIRGYDAYADRAGINGQAGDARAMEGFDRSVYGRAGQEQAANDTLRRFANMGMLGSGNAAYGMANALNRNRVDNYSRYAALASPYLSLAPQIAGAMGSNDAALAGMANQLGRDRANFTAQQLGVIGQAGGNALAAGDQVQQQRTNLAISALGLISPALSAALGGAGGMGGMSNLFAGLFNTSGAAGGMNNMPMNLRTTGSLY